MKYTVIYSRQAQKDAKKLKKSNLKESALELIKVLEKNPLQNPPRYEALRGELKGCYSRRINIQHRLVYEILEEEKIVHVLRMWTHYE
ncbi:Txe/YoeB family addiction module toxin [Puniceicoccales bacterium CK1056]|uniref:Putative mRNA interferase YoeB n=1 Tax=Oceanipulchritudo coccoides TaxID=2706888 RepID=A0A6B2M0P4_9BACT|nr:Txe/YoeB family addiction module toxin [Oceanipulchritudo coccoides]